MQLYGHYSVSYYCKLFGRSRQAFYEQIKSPFDKGLQDALMLKLVGEIRADLPRFGADKLHFMLEETFAAHAVKLGRDGLYRLLGKYGLLIRYRNRKPYTTHSHHHYKKYPNLIRDMVINGTGQLWVSDITYIRQVNGFSYLSIITDAYSTATAASNTAATIYVKMIEHFGIQLSMTEKGDPYENAIAERVNGILKHEHGLQQTFATYQQASAAVDEGVSKYNEIRIHDSCDRLTPVMALEQKGILKKHWKSKKYQRKAEVTSST